MSNCKECGIKVVEMYQDYPREVDGNARHFRVRCLIRQLSQRTAERDALQAIVDKLQFTKDKVSITLGMDVFDYDDGLGEPCEYQVVGMEFGEASCSVVVLCSGDEGVEPHLSHELSPLPKLLWRQQMSEMPLESITGGNQPAFPVPANPDYCCGMTLRDWFAGQALVGGLAALAHPDSYGAPGDHDERAKFAVSTYQIADAMIAELEASK